MTVFTFLALAAGLAFLVGGAELLVKGAAAAASRLGVEPVIIGLTVVAFGTSAPELAVSISATAGDSADVALGNVVGSNISNILLILGVSALFGGLVVSQRIIRIDVPLVLGASVAVLLLSLDNRIGRLDGAVLFAGIVTYTVWLVIASRSERSEVRDEHEESVDVEGGIVDRALPVQLAYVAVGIGVLVAGAQLLVGGATDIAEAFGISDLVIGLTVVAIGTSLPELATSLMASLRGQRDIAVGSVVGSNLFNVLCVLGLTGVVSGDVPVTDTSLRLDIPVMLAATVVLVPIFWSGFRIARWEGAVLVVFYALYVGYLVLDASDSSAAEVVGPAALLVTPLVLLTLAVTGVQGWRRHRAAVSER